MMHEVLVLPAAEADLDAIAIYTKEQWGHEQARKYALSLRRDIEGLGQFPKMYSGYESQHGKFHKAISGEHLIFYRVIETRVEVVRVLHNRMDVEDKL